MIHKDDLIVVCGAGGFIGGHLVQDILNKGYKKIRAVDIKPTDKWYQIFEDVDNIVGDLQDFKVCQKVVNNARWIYNLAADMGGMGFIENNKALCMLSVLINTHLLKASKESDVERFFFSSSACVYAHDKQVNPQVPGLLETDAYPASPEDGYGWEKLFSERMCRHFTEDFNLSTRMARYHNVYGPNGTFDGGREKAPAAIARKVIEAKLSNNHKINIWGTGEQTRSFMYIDDCVFGTQLIMESSDVDFPINLGSDEQVTINKLVDITEEISGIKLKREYDLNAPKGVNGRNSDNTLIKKSLKWEPSINLKKGMEKTYAWIYDEIISGRSKGSVVNN